MKYIKYSFILCLIATSSTTRGQSGLSLYHLHNGTFQANNFNPAFIPDGKVLLGLPAISGVALDFNINNISYSQAVKKDANGTKTFDFQRIASESVKNNYIGAEADISIFYLGIKPNYTTAFTFFIRERVNAKLFYGGDLVDMLWNGNTEYLGKSIDLKSTAVNATHYREYGLGIWKNLPKKDIDIGVRVKLLTGMFNVSSNKNFSGSVGFEQIHGKMSLSFNNTVINTSGWSLTDSTSLLTSHLRNNQNIGFGIDLGAHWKINKQVSIAFAVNDLGYIKWKVRPRNYTLADTTFQFNGVGDLSKISELSDIFTNLVNKTFNRTEDEKDYTTMVNALIVGSAIYQLTPNDKITGSISSSVVSKRFLTQYAVGITHKFGRIFDLTANAVRTPQQGIDLGMAFALNLGSYQLYMASDKIIGLIDVPKASAGDLRFGMNFIFGKEKFAKTKNVRSATNKKNEKGEKSDGIYQIIPLQRQPDVYQYKDQ